jgi:glycosyltransferase involved in cell wall biosynthesis
MITYNHEKYIKQAIESILYQKTDFEIELVIGEDFSSDKTRSICEELAKKYPDKINLLPSDRRYGMIENFVRVYKSCKGKYIALCEGDDYWTDPLKLKKQVDFLQNNSEYVLCFHKASVLYNDKITNVLNHSRQKGPITFDEFIVAPDITTCTVVFRNDDININWMNSEYKVGDVPFYLYLLTKGNGYFMPENMAVYRKGIGWTKQGNQKKISDYLYTMELFLADVPLTERKKKLVEESNIRNKFYLQCFDFDENLKAEYLTPFFPYFTPSYLKNVLSFKQAIEVVLFKIFKKMRILK